MNLAKIITVGNGDNSYYGNFTKKEKELIKHHILGFSLNLFSGKSLIGNARVDYTCAEATVNCDVFEYLETCVKFPISVFDTIIIDAPYNQKFADKYQKLGNTPKQFVIFANTKDTTNLFNLIRAMNPKRIILKSWNYYCVKDYFVSKCYVCYAGGYRKSTFLIVMDKVVK